MQNLYWLDYNPILYTFSPEYAVSISEEKIVHIFIFWPIGEYGTTVQENYIFFKTTFLLKENAKLLSD